MEEQTTFTSTQLKTLLKDDLIQRFLTLQTNYEKVINENLKLKDIINGMNDRFAKLEATVENVLKVAVTLRCFFFVVFFIYLSTTVVLVSFGLVSLFCQKFCDSAKQPWFHLLNLKRFFTTYFYLGCAITSRL